MDKKENVEYSADFLVSYRFLSKEEGGRQSGTPFQGYRCDWLYEGDDPKVDGIYMIHPEFLTEEGEVFESEKSVPSEGVARMKIIFSEMKEYHQNRIKEGTKGYFVEGPKKVGEATVTKILGLNSKNP